MTLIRTEEEALGKGALTFAGQISNITWSPEELANLIHRRSLYVEEVPGGNLWFCRSETRTQLFFQVDRDQTDHLQPDLLPSEDCVSELLFMVAQQQKKDPERNVLQKLGLTKVCLVQFLSFTKQDAATVSDSPFLFRVAERTDDAEIRRMYDACFDRLTDAIPDGPELAERIARGEVWNLCEKETGETLGSIMLQRNKSRVLARHLVIAPAWQHQGIGTILMNELIRSMRTGEKCMLWVKEDNIPALRLYQRMGFSPQGRKMEIWVKRKSVAVSS